MKIKFTITSLTSTKKSSIIGLNSSLSLSTILIHLISTFWYQPATLLSTSTLSINSLQTRRIACFQVKQVSVSLSSLVISSVQLNSTSMLTQRWTSLPKPTPKTYSMSSLIRTNSPRKEEPKSDHSVVKRWSSLLMILTCLHYKNSELNLRMNCWDRLSIKEVFTIWKSSSSWKFLTVCLSLHVLHQAEVEIKSVQDFSDISTWFGLQIFQSSPWISFSHQYWKDFWVYPKGYKNSLLQLLNLPWKSIKRSEHNCCQLQLKLITHSTWEIWVRSSKEFCQSNTTFWTINKLWSAYGSMKPKEYFMTD